MSARNNLPHWSECERALFAVAGMEPSRYERIIIAVRALADALREVATGKALAAAWEGADALLQKVAEARGLSMSELPAQRVAGAAFALRAREIEALTLRQGRISRLQAARRSRESWVVVEQAGDVDEGLFDPYRSTELHLASGLAILSFVQADPSSGAPIYVVGVAKLDRKTGALIDAEPGFADWHEHAGKGEFEAARNALRERIDAMPQG